MPGRLFHYSIFLCFLVFHSHVLSEGQQEHFETLSDKALEEILEDAEFAITERNLRITGRLHVGKAIQEHGNPGFPDYEIIMYCSLSFAEKILTLAPELINSCPGRITVRGHGDKYIISGSQWPENTDNMELNRHMQKMNILVKQIIHHAAKDWFDTHE